MVKDEWPKHTTRMDSREFSPSAIIVFIFPPQRVPASFPLLKKSVVSLWGLVTVLADLPCLITSRQEQVSLSPSWLEGALSRFLVHG